MSEKELTQKRKTVHRYASIDFLRGTAIVVMLFLHVTMHSLDVDSLLPRLAHLPLINAVALIVLPFLGGMAGLFLMVSAIGNMVSMSRRRKAGQGVKDLIVKQVTGGMLLLVFAMIVESAIGYHGSWGHLISGAPADSIVYRVYHFETIHTIAWCVTLNGLVQGVLARRDPGKLIRCYVVLAGIVVAVTPLLWRLASLAIPGYPYAIDPGTGYPVQYVVFGKSPFSDFIVKFFLAPLAGHPEPIFPYLAVSFLGSAIGIILEERRRFPKRMAVAAATMFGIGTLGILASGTTIDLYLRIWDHRYWVPDNGAPALGWLSQFVALTGAAMGAVLLVLRLVEYRGKGRAFARRTRAIRRYGTVAFSVYTFQWVYYLAIHAASALWGKPFGKLDWGGTLFAIALTFLFSQVILRLWENVDYMGGVEWCLGALLRRDGRRRQFDDADWIDLAPEKPGVCKRWAIVSAALVALLAVLMSLLITPSDLGI